MRFMLGGTKKFETNSIRFLQHRFESYDTKDYQVYNFIKWAPSLRIRSENSNLKIKGEFKFTNSSFGCILDPIIPKPR